LEATGALGATVDEGTAAPVCVVVVDVDVGPVSVVGSIEIDVTVVPVV